MTVRPISELLRRPVVAAPMAAGPSAPGLVTAVARAGALGFLAAGYKTAAAMLAEISAVRAVTAEPFGVNVFVPGAAAADPAAVASYVSGLAADAGRLGAGVGVPAWDDDDWDAKIAALLADPPAVVSFTFGCPAPEVVAALRAAGSAVWVTVTDPAEAAVAAAAGADCLCAQGAEAGAHRGTFANDTAARRDYGVRELIGAIRQVTSLPLVAAGGIMDAAAVRAARAAGAVAAQCGTAFLRCQESGAHPAHKAALADPRFTATAVTRAFSGRPARGLVNQFMLDHPAAPAAYPEVNNDTRPLRAAAAAALDTSLMSLWAGEGYRASTTLAAAEIVELLCRE
jgi:nitronate monooxygenase